MFKLKQLPLEITSLCCVQSRIKLQHRNFLKPLQRKGEKTYKLNSSKTLKVNRGAATIFKDFLKGQNENFEKSLSVLRLDKLKGNNAT